MTSEYIVTILGALIAVVGLILTAVQLLRRSARDSRKRHVTAKAGPVSFGLATTYPGLIVLAFGVLLLVVGALLSR